jgi:hypothetical protein
MKNLSGFASRCLAVIVTAAVACASPQAPLLGSDPDAGIDAMPDAAEPGAVISAFQPDILAGLAGLAGLSVVATTNESISLNPSNVSTAILMVRA